MKESRAKAKRVEAAQEPLIDNMTEAPETAYKLSITPKGGAEPVQKNSRESLKSRFFLKDEGAYQVL